jgi:hypothetical protein
MPGTSCGPVKASAFPRKGRPRGPRGTGVGGAREAASGERSAPSRVAARTMRESPSPGFSFAALPPPPEAAAKARRDLAFSGASSR